MTTTKIIAFLEARAKMWAHLADTFGEATDLGPPRAGSAAIARELANEDREILAAIARGGEDLAPPTVRP